MKKTGKRWGSRYNLLGQVFGRWTVIAFDESVKAYEKSRWICKCECGVEKSVLQDSLLAGRSLSCGCYEYELTSIRSRTHGESSTHLYKAWNSMKERCLYEKFPGYKDYGGRGIVICDEWVNDYLTFKEWALNNGYAKTLSLDRIDVNGNYTPQNCRWITMSEQQHNKRTNVFLEYNGERHTLAQWGMITGLGKSTIISRKNKGWSVEQILTTPKLCRNASNPRIIEYNGEGHSIREWSEIFNIPRQRIDKRIGAGWNLEEVFNKPPRNMHKKHEETV
jgi:hypothetical protein